MAQQWEVVGGAEKGGIVVREGKDLKSRELPERLSTGALVEELSLVGERLRYRRLAGAGPDEGWVSLRLKEKALVVRTLPTVCPPSSGAGGAKSRGGGYPGTAFQAGRFCAAGHRGSCGCLEPAPTSTAERAPPLPEVAKLSLRVTRVVGRNPGPYSLTGTNMYLVGTGALRILVDAGEGKPGVLGNLLDVMRAEGCTGLQQIVITHWHHDHLMGVPELLEHFGPIPVRKYMPPEGTAVGAKDQNGGYHFDPNEFLENIEVTPLADNEVLRCEGAELRVLFTPGHANDHVCLMLECERAIFTGDNILGWGTGVFQDLQLYLASLRKVLDLRPEILYPAHGPMIERGKAVPWIQYYIYHREERVGQVSKALRDAGQRGLTLEMLTKEVYREQPHVLKTEQLLKGAKNNCKLVLEFLEREGQCRIVRDHYFFSKL